jgi:hypothetical protein
MNTKQRSIVIFVLVMSLTMSSCGPGQLFGPTVTPTPTTTPTTTPTPIPPTSTPTPIPPSPTPTLVPNSIYGIITIEGKPIVNTTVYVNLEKSTKSEKVSSTETDAEGNYIFTNLKPDTYQLSLLWKWKNEDWPCSDSTLPTMGGRLFFDMSNNGSLGGDVRRDSSGIRIAVWLGLGELVITQGDSVKKDIKLRCSQWLFMD